MHGVLQYSTLTLIPVSSFCVINVAVLQSLMTTFLHWVKTPNWHGLITVTS